MLVKHLSSINPGWLNFYFLNFYLCSLQYKSQPTLSPNTTGNHGWSLHIPTTQQLPGFVPSKEVPWYPNNNTEEVRTVKQKQVLPKLGKDKFLEQKHKSLFIVYINITRHFHNAVKCTLSYYLLNSFLFLMEEYLHNRHCFQAGSNNSS